MTFDEWWETEQEVFHTRSSLPRAAYEAGQHNSTAEEQLRRVTKALHLLVNSATQTKDQDSCGRDYAHVSQTALNAARKVLLEQGVDPKIIGGLDNI